MSLRTASAGLVCLASLLGQSARASGERAEGVDLPPVTVPLPPPDLAVETPTRRDPTGVVSKVEPAQHAGEAKDAAELLGTSPGVFVQDLGGLGQSKTLSLRGASPNGVLFFLDGIPLNGAGGQVDLAAIPSAIIERFEVLRGGAGTRYGSGGLGGAVNIVTKEAKGGAHLAGETSYGSFDTSTAQVGGSASLLGGEGLAIAHYARSAGDFPYVYNPTPQLPSAPLAVAVRQNNDARVAGGLLKWKTAVGQDAYAELVAEASQLDRGLAGTIQQPTSTSRESDQRLAATARAVKELGAWELSARAWVRRDASDIDRGYAGGALRQVTAVGGAEALADYTLGRHALELTAQAGRESLAEAGETGPARTVLSAMASDEILFKGGLFSLVPSFRVDRAGTFLGVSPKLGASAQLPWELTARANVGQAFRAPSFLELYVQQGTFLPNPTLQPERALYADAQLERASSWGSLSAGGFYALYQNLISYELYPPQLAKPYNFYAARVAGLEAEGDVHPRPWVSGAFGYTLTFSQNLRDDPRYYLKELPYRPRHRLNARAAAGPLWAQGRCEVVYQDEQYVNRAQSPAAALPPRAFVNLGFTSQLSSAPQVKASVELKNVFDTQAQDFDGYPLPGRAIYVTLSASWDKTDSTRSPQQTLRKP